MIKILRFVVVLFALAVSFIFYSCKEKNENDINISKSEALEIAKRYDISGNNVEIFFNTYIYSKSSLGYKEGKRKLFYWNVSKKCNHCSCIQIDAVTGKVFFESKYTYVY